MGWESSRPKHVPTKVRDECLQRDNYQCVARLNTGHRCPERDPSKLEAAHIRQWQRGERTTADMVRTLCTWHHGKETTQQAANARRRRNRAQPYHPREQHPGRN